MGIAIPDAMLAKFSAPEVPRFHFLRPGLSARFRRWTEFPLTVIAAPAGYGKTTLVAEGLRSWSGPRCWIALDEGDSNPARFLASLAQGLAGAHPVLAECLAHPPGSFSNPDPDTLLSGLQIALDRLPCQMVTVLDDCALLASPQVRRLAARFLSSVPYRAHFILLTRDPGVLPLSRWRLRQEVLELGPRDLALDEEEFERWGVERLGLRLEPELRRRWHGLFEGWLAGLQLLALKLDGEKDRLAALEDVDPSHPFLFEYLLEEVLRRLPQEWKRFLLETSVLVTLLPDLCDEVRLSGNSAHLMEALHDSQCFLVPLEGGGGYRYHRLFGECLRGLLSRWDPGEVPSLHRRAARWHLRRGSLDAALEHALTAEDGDTLEALAARALENLFRNGEFTALQRHIRRIPAALCQGRPWLSVFCAWAFFHTGREQDGEARLKDAERILQSEGRPEKAVRPASRVLWAHLCLLKGILARLDGAISRGLDWVKRGEALAPAEARFLHASLAAQAGVMHFLGSAANLIEPALHRALAMSRDAGHHLAHFGAAYTLAEHLGLMGRLEEAGRFLEDCEASAEALPERGESAAGYLRLARARWLRRLGRPEAAAVAAEEGIAAGLAGGNNRILGYGHSIAAQLRLDAGDGEAAFAHLEKAESFGLRNRMHWAVDLDDLRALRIRCLGPARERPSADAWMARERAGLARPDRAGQDRARTAVALIRWRGDSGGAARLALQWAEHASREGWLGAALDFRRLAAESVASSAEKDRHLRAASALEERMGLSALRRSAVPVTVAASGPLHDLSDREVEVLRAMREGKSNKEIAGTLFVAPSTVKTHLKNIFTKLGVDNRVKAVTRAVEDGILR